MSSTLVTPELIYTPWGVDATNPTYITIPIPVPSQIGTTINRASFTDGFPPSTMTPEASGGLPFFGQDMNGILYMVTAYCANFAAGALSTYNSTLASNVDGYPVGVVLVNENGNGLWVNQTNGNSANPDTTAAGWLPLAVAGGSSIAVTSTAITLTPSEAAYPFLNFTGTLTGNTVITVPTYEGQQWVVANSTSGAYSLTVKTSAGSGVAVPATGVSAPTSLYCDGTNIQNTGVSTAGLAPINSPALTGTPTAPTAASSSNTTQIATTAFTQAAITAALAVYARTASPVFTGTPTAPTASPGTNTTQLATTAFVQAAVAAAGAIKIRAFSLTLNNGPNTVAFSAHGGNFPTTCDAVTVNPVGSNAEAYLTALPTATGFSCNVGVTQTYTVIAIGS